MGCVCELWGRMIDPERMEKREREPGVSQLIGKKGGRLVYQDEKAIPTTLFFMCAKMLYRHYNL